MEMLGLRLSAHRRRPARDLPNLQAQVRIRERDMLHPGMRADGQRPQAVKRATVTIRAPAAPARNMLPAAICCLAGTAGDLRPAFFRGPGSPARNYGP